MFRKDSRSLCAIIVHNGLYSACHCAWLGIDSFVGSRCPFCPTHSLDPLDHRALTCKYNEDVVSCQNRPRGAFFKSCRQAGVCGKMEAGIGLGHGKWCTRPANVLISNWDLGKPAAFDLTVISLLNPITLYEACVTAGSSAQISEQRKHASSDAKCSQLGWACIPLAVENYGCWGAEARVHLSRLASCLAAGLNNTKSQPPSCSTVGLTWSLSELMQGHCYLEQGHMAMAQMPYKHLSLKQCSS